MKFRNIYWQLGPRSELEIYNKLLLYIQALRSVWTYVVQLWGCEEKSNIEILQRYLSKVLRCLVNAPWYTRNSDIYRELGVETIASIIARHATSYENRLQHHVNEEASNVKNLIRRLNRTKLFELVKQFDI
jgi:hypothetical protein